MQGNLIKAIKTLGITVIGLSATNLFLDKAKDNQTGQYCVFFPVNDDPAIDSGTQFEHEYVQFDFYGTNLSNLDTLVSNFKTVFDFTDSLSVTGYTVIEVRRIRERGPRKFGDVWQINLEYFIQLEKSR